MIDLKYRPEIDGLRAVAVILVLLFHADLGFSGGFIGVDVFFVISGFLITGLILKKQRVGTFQLSEFWVRRIRRILPASIAMVLMTLIVGGMFLMPMEYEKLAKTAFYHQLMVSNIYFWRHTGYFDGAAELKPLLHTWSLSVEEQFYLFYPFLLVWLNRFRERVKFSVLFGLCLVSFVGSEWMVRTEQGAAFFLLPFRAWEMLCGGLICFFPNPRFLPRLVANSLSLISLGGIFACGWYFSDTMRFPGISAAWPCLATAVFIYANSSHLTLTGRILSLKPVVFVGLISYSLYLVHWPILVYLRTEYGLDLPISVAFSALALSVILAVLSWRFVERPFRTGTLIKSRNSLVKTAIAIPAMILMGTLAIELLDGLPQRLPRKAQSFLENESQDKYWIDLRVDQIISGDIPVFGDPEGDHRMAVWGDSHAMAMMRGIDHVCQKWRIKCYQLTHSGNPPLLDYVPEYNAKTNAQIPERNQAIVDFILREKIPVVMMTAWWASHSNKQPEQFQKSFHKTVRRLQEANVKVIVMEDVATQKFLVPSYLASRAWRGESVEECGLPLKVHYKNNRRSRKAFRMAKSPNLRVYDPTPQYAGDSSIWPAQIDGASLFGDQHHLTAKGAMHLTPLIEKSILESVPNIAGDPAQPFH